MTGYESFKLYIPVKLHFTTLSFDIFETPRVRHTGVEYYNKRADKYLFEKLARRFKEPRECVEYYAANFSYGCTNFLYDPVAGGENYTTWIKRKETISYTFKSDLDTITDLFDSNQLDTGNDYQQLFFLYMENRISHETLVILNSLMGLFDKWQSSPAFMMIWKDDMLRLTKSVRFIRYDKSKIKSIYDKWNTDISLNIV